MSNLKWRQQRTTVSGIPLDLNLQNNNFAVSSSNAARRGLFAGPERRRRWRRGGILLLLALSLIGYTAFRRTQLQELSSAVRDAYESIPRQDATSIVLDTPLLIFTCTRHEYLNRTLAAVWAYHPLNPQSPSKQTSPIIAGAPIVISQDGNDPSVRAVIQQYAKLFQSVHVPFYHIQHEAQLILDPYHALSQHYGWALETLFSGKAYVTEDRKQSSLGLVEPLPQRVILLEEDLEIAIDFFSYMSAMAPLLDTDASLLAISAYNDNGKKGLVGDPLRLVRSDFFPGLGWMMHASLWKQLQPWPKAYWDDWLREPPQRKGRQVIRPEISRTYHFGSKGGASYNQYSSHLDTILLNKQNVDWSQQDLSYLDKDTFTRKYNQDVASALLLYMDPDEWHETKIRDQIMDMLRQSSVKIEYNNWDDFVMLANMMNLMDNEKAGVPRTAFQGIVECRPHGPGGNILYLIPASS